MTKPQLNAPRIVPRIGQRVAAGVPQHVEVDGGERQAGTLADTLHKQIDSIRAEWPVALGGTHRDDRGGPTRRGIHCDKLTQARCRYQVALDTPSASHGRIADIDGLATSTSRRSSRHATSTSASPG